MLKIIYLKYNTIFWNISEVVYNQFFPPLFVKISIDVEFWE